MAAMTTAAAQTKHSPYSPFRLKSAVHFNLLPLLPCEVGTIFASQMVRLWPIEKLSNWFCLYRKVIPTSELREQYEKAFRKYKALYKWQQCEEPATDELTTWSFIKL